MSFDNLSLDNLSFEQMLIFVVLWILTIVAKWLVYEKAGEKGWKSIVPFYSDYILYKISWGNGWLFLLGLIPFVGWIADIVQMHKLSKSFGHGIGYTLGLLFLPSIFMLILGFSDDKYVGPAV